ncbi:MAG TPA: hypothetical protein VEJ88_08010 [Dissulfurispiraceae bacterium]|nr:hypothetical protein [Dissulfurispiraceae bacterium]
MSGFGQVRLQAAYNLLNQNGQQSPWLQPGEEWPPGAKRKSSGDFFWHDLARPRNDTDTDADPDPDQKKEQIGVGIGIGIGVETGS